MKAIKFYIDNTLWERFFRLFPGHGERSSIMRKVVRNIISISDELPSLDAEVAKRVMEDWKDEA